MKQLELPEKYIQQQIMNYLRYKGYYVMRLNSGKYAVGEGRTKRFVMGQEAGTPDLMAFKDHTVKGLVELNFIEVKRPGNKPTRLQELKMKELTEYGARCIVATSIEELQKQL